MTAETLEQMAEKALREIPGSGAPFLTAFGRAVAMRCAEIADDTSADMGSPDSVAGAYTAARAIEDFAKGER